MNFFFPYGSWLKLECGKPLRASVGESGKGNPLSMSESREAVVGETSPADASQGITPNWALSSQETWEELFQAQTKRALFHTRQERQRRWGSQHLMPETSFFPIFHLISWLPRAIFLFRPTCSALGRNSIVFWSPLPSLFSAIWVSASAGNFFPLHFKGNGMPH